jgi:hypothetical protein
MDPDVVHPDVTQRAAMSFFATCPKGTEELLEAELLALGAAPPPRARGSLSADR